MKHLWVNHENNPQLLLFFSGWGIDEKPTDHLVCDGMDVLLFYDYSTAACDLDLTELAGHYKCIHLLAWSLGVWAAQEALENLHIKFSTAAALNGTLNPISETQGIPPQIFAGTIVSWSQPAQIKFNRRMCGSSENFVFFNTHAPNRSIDDQKTELIAMERRINQSGEIKSCVFKSAVISDSDRIVPAKAQENFWLTRNATINKIESAHYFFAGMSCWQEVLDIAKA